LLENYFGGIFQKIPMAVRGTRLREGAKSFQQYNQSSDQLSEILWIGLGIVVVALIVWIIYKINQKKNKFF
ncbi:MAG: hypothetical protein OEY59_11215, partial [Deltaproteobacteria bacterium]|nr:hypothetical protein [Deltaproteobacteria bacterium]